MSETNIEDVHFESKDFDLFGRYPSSRPFGDVAAADRARFKSVREKLKKMAEAAARSFSDSVRMKEHASLFSPNGRSATDLWCCIYPDTIPNKSFGLQFALILNGRGAEFCCCLGAGTSQVSDPDSARQFSIALADTKQRLGTLDRSVVDAISDAIGGEWDFRKRWRQPPGTRDFSSFEEWLAYARSSESSGASISKNLDVSTVIQLGREIENQFQQYGALFRPLIEGVYAPRTTASIPQTDQPKIPAWIFQCNPRYHDLERMLAHKSEFSWLVNQYADRMHVDDTVFLWEAGQNAGILAVAKIISPPRVMPAEPDEAEFNLVEDRFAGAKPRVRLRVVTVLEHRLLRADLLKVSELADLSIFKFANNTNFVVRESERDAIFAKLRSQGVKQAPAKATETSPPSYRAYGPEDILSDGCFFDRSEIDRILDRLHAKKNLILQGPPGTGKTWLAKRLAFALIGKKDDSRVRAVQFHPNLSYEDFVRGWRPTGDGKLSLADGVFMEAINAAHHDPLSSVVVVIEEINRGNPAQIFGELLTLLEADKRTSNDALELCYPDADGKRRPVYIPENLFVIGTMNVADRSLALVDLALRRRFAFVSLEPKLGAAWRRWVVEKCNIDPALVGEIERRITILNDQITSDARLGPQFRIGHSYVTPPYPLAVGDTQKWFRQVVETEIGPLLEEYWFDAPDEARKVCASLIQSW